MIAETIVDTARGCVGTKFRHQGRIAGQALDCAGLAVVALRSAGVEVKDLTNYSRTPHDDKLRKVLDMQPGLYSVSVSDMSSGDILLIRIGTQPSHIAIYAGEGRIIHSYEIIGRVVEHRIDPAWQSQIMAVYRARLPE